MAAVHMDASAVVGSTLINEAEEKIQYVKYRPVQPLDSKSPVNFTIPGNSSQYVSLRDSYLFVECHLEKTDAMGNKLFMMMDQPQPSRKRSAEEALGPTKPEKNRKKRIPNGQRSEEGEKEEEEEEVMMASGPGGVTTRAELAKLLEDAEAKYAEAQTAYADADAQKSYQAKYDEAIAVAETVEDMAVQQMKNYITAKKRLKFLDNLDGYVVPVDNILHTLWNGVDIIINQELVSTTNQKYMYKAYIESVLNNSAKKYELEMQGFYGDQGDKDQDFRQTFNPGMTKRYMQFKDDKKVQLMGFLHLDIMGIQGSIVNGVEINISLLPN